MTKKAKAASLADLKPAPYNPRTITEEALRGLKKSLSEFGDLSGITFNTRTGHLVSGHQRVRALQDEHGDLAIKDGAIRLPDGNVIQVRAVDWDLEKEKLGNLAANNPHIQGDWSEDIEAMLKGLPEGDLFEDLNLDQLMEDIAKPVIDQTPATAAEPKDHGALARKFLFPPFSVLSARSGEWQDRKREWLSLGMKSELGRDVDANPSGKLVEMLQGNAGGKLDTGISIFDPVLCELAYAWYSARGDQVVDPFAGGSVRGIVATVLGRRYHGIDLSGDQIQANNQQATELVQQHLTVNIELSGPMLRQRFHPCEADFINGICKGRCCEGSKGISVVVDDTEKAFIEAQGVEVVDGYIKADDRGLCPFKSEEGFCTIHEHKPLGCKASPFTFNDKGLMIVRNRYRKLKCYNCDGSVPAYEAHRWSLVQIFGEAETDKIAELAEAGAERIPARMSYAAAQILARNHNRRNDAKLAFQPNLHWVEGDSVERLAEAPEADFVFSCPPYGDLEVYSEDPRDISSMEYETFLDAYRRIIQQACERLKDDRFACFVVGDFRDKKGILRNFVSETIGAFLAAGLQLYNEAILVTAVGTATLRAGKTFSASRKLCKTHQNVLVFCKGDPKRATERLGPVETKELADDETT